MLPSKDIVNDINKLFSRNTNNDGDSPFTYTSPFQAGNRSSSSADSISPESYYDLYRPELTLEAPNYSDLLSFQGLTQDLNNIFDNFNSDPRSSNSVIDSPTSSLHTSTTQMRLRPIVGRRILGSSESIRTERAIQINNQSNYELFPIEKKEYDFYTPTKNNTNDFNIAHQSPPVQQNLFSPKPYVQKISNFSTFTPISTPPSVKDDFGTKMCTFCRKNGERPEIYMTHCVKEKMGNRHKVTCPILRSHKCVTCGASGDNAHTLTYCPVLRSNNNGRPLQSTTITLKSTRIKSNGKRRY